jgi:hypothetical protein
MRLVHSVAMLAIATGVAGTIADVNAASPPADTQIAESKGIQAKDGRAGSIQAKDGRTDKPRESYRPNPAGDGTTEHFKTKK